MLGSSRWTRMRGTVVGVWVLVVLLGGGPMAHAGLPDGRGYELVSPPDKLGSDVVAESSRTRAAAGESAASPAAVTFLSLGGFADVQGTGVATEYMAMRTGVPGTSGWATHGITPRQEALSFGAVAQALEPFYDWFMSNDLSKGLFRSWSPLTTAPNVAEVPNLYVREDLRTPGSGSYRLLTDAASPLAMPDLTLGRAPIVPFVAGASQDLEHVLFESDFPLTADARGGYPKLYKRDGAVTRLIAPAGECPGGTARLDVTPGQCSAAGAGARAFRYTPRVLSEDGSRVIFTSPVLTSGLLGLPNDRVGVAAKLFQLDDRGTISTSDDAVAHLNASEARNPTTAQPARYQFASVDGSRVFFISGEQLTESGGGGLYMWERQSVNETQEVGVDATGGTFALTLHSQVSTGTADLESGSATVTAVAGSFAVGQTVTGVGIPTGTTIASMGRFNNESNATLTLSQAATLTAQGQALGASFGATTEPITHDASPSEVQSALEAMPDIGAGNVSVSSGPGGGPSYLVSFTGALAGVNIAQLEADSSGLNGGAADVTVDTATDLKNLTLIASIVPANDDGVLGGSEDGRHIYFVATAGLLGDFGNVEREVYYWQDSDGAPGGELSVIGGVAGGDARTLSYTSIPNFEPKVSRVTPDGGLLLLVVSRGGGLAPRRDHGSRCPDGNANSNETGGCSEAYVYRPESSSPTVPDVVCASCPGSGQTATRSAWVNLSRGGGGTRATPYLNRPLSDDGRYVFFSSAEALVPEDTNGRSDAYEYDVATDTRHLISSGKDPSDSYFLDASTDGHDVFFMTRERLVGWDTDNAYDVYDARVSGGLPEPTPVRTCDGDACQGPAPGVLAPAVVGSAGFRGSGNAVERTRPHRAARRCARGKVKRRVNGRVRCVRARRGRRSHRRERSSGERGAR